MRTISFDGVIVGGGGAGMRAALQLVDPPRASAEEASHQRRQVTLPGSAWAHQGEGVIVREGQAVAA